MLQLNALVKDREDVDDAEVVEVEVARLRRLDAENQAGDKAETLRLEDVLVIMLIALPLLTRFELLLQVMDILLLTDEDTLLLMDGVTAQVMRQQPGLC